VSTAEKIDLPNTIPTSLEAFDGLRQVDLWTTCSQSMNTTSHRPQPLRWIIRTEARRGRANDPVSSLTFILSPFRKFSDPCQDCDNLLSDDLLFSEFEELVKEQQKVYQISFFAKKRCVS
jgi:hypothetical protein